MYRMWKLIPSRRRPPHTGRGRRRALPQLTLSPRADAAVAVALLTAVGAALVAEGGALRAVTLILVGANVALAAFLGWPVSGHAALAAAAVYLILETLDGRMDAAHAPLRLLVAVLIVLTVLAGGLLRRGAASPGATPARKGGEAGSARAAPGSLAYELDRAERHRRPFSLLVVRPDNLEHLAASGAEGLARLLDVIGQAISDSVRKIDVVSRRGEHRFELVLPETDAASARTVAERIRLQVDAARPEVAPGRLLGISISVGIAAYPTDGAAADALVDAAERALARALDLGGNRTLLFSVPPGAPQGWGLVSGTAGGATPPPRPR
jgi:diguanylate cyclase (GGDEF)-like protein